MPSGTARDEERAEVSDTPQHERQRAGGGPGARSLEGARVIVAGASGGLGRSIAAELRRRGAQLTVVARSLEGLPAGDDVVAVAGDIADPEVCERAVRAAAAGGSIDGVVNVAGVVAFGPLVELDDDVLVRLFETNVLGPLRLVRAALPHLDGGFVANVTGAVAAQPMAGLAAYSASKAALAAASDALRRELRRQRIDVVDLQPPHTETGLAQRPIAGTAPRLPAGLAPDAVAHRIVEAIVQRERTVVAEDFAASSAA